MLSKSKVQVLYENAVLAYVNHGNTSPAELGQSVYLLATILELPTTTVETDLVKAKLASHPGIAFARGL